MPIVSARSTGMPMPVPTCARAVRDDPTPAAFEGWLLERCLAGAGVTGVGPVRAMAQEVLLEWRLAQRPGAFRRWLARGAPSDDTRPSRA